MTGNRDAIVAIIIKYALDQPLSQEETRILEEWRKQSPEQRDLPDQLKDPRWREEHRRQLADAPSAGMWANIFRSTQEELPSATVIKTNSRRRIISWVTAAVIIPATLILGAIQWSRSKGPGIAAKREMTNNVVAAAGITGDYRARLLSNDGSLIEIDTALDGEVILQDNGVTVTKRDSLTLVYSLSPGATVLHMLHIGNRIDHPFRVEFPDGTRVFLRTGSELTYGADLRAGTAPHLDGEAFFVIGNDSAHRPLRIDFDQRKSVTVLATSFDIKSYPGGKTSQVGLFAGKVRVNSGDDSILLHPGSVALLTGEQPPEIKAMHEALPAWMRPPATSPYFEFDNTPLSAALREVANWYLVNVSNPHKVSGIPITGRLPRNQPLEVTLRNLEQVESGHAYLRRKADTIVVLSGDQEPR